MSGNGVEIRSGPAGRVNIAVSEDIQATRPHSRVTAVTDGCDEYLIVHVGKTEGGFAKRFSMFAAVLRKRRPTYVKGPVVDETCRRMISKAT